MNRPKFAVGEVAEIASKQCPELNGVQDEIVSLGWHVGTKYVGWQYLLNRFREPRVAGRSAWWAESALRKRPDLREPFSLKALKEKYAPQREEA